MKKIPLTKGKFALVDDEDYESLIQWKWHLGTGGYAKRSVFKEHGAIFMHRAINCTPDGMLTDHINGNRLDNRRINLRSCTKSENVRNQKPQTRKKTSPYKGVHLYKKTPHQKWCAKIKKNKKLVWFKYFDTEIEAAIAYNNAAKKYHGEFACINNLLP